MMRITVVAITRFCILNGWMTCLDYCIKLGTDARRPAPVKLSTLV